MSDPIKVLYFSLPIVLMLFQPVPANAANQDVGNHYYIELEAGPVWQSNNDVQLPGENGTRFSFKDLTGDGPFAAI
jgi:hypothetical protein